LRASQDQKGLKRLSPKIALGVVDAVLYANRWLRVRYKGAEDFVSDKRVMPLGLAQRGPCLYLVCRYEPKGDNRSLALPLRDFSRSLRCWARSCAPGWAFM
jgi:hypothetical protein